MPPLSINERSLDGPHGLVVAPRGQIRATNGAEFRAHVDGLLEGNAFSRLVLDFSDVEFIDSSTAGYLLNVHDRMRQQGGSLALAALMPSVRLVIDSIGLTTFFTVCETVEDAERELL